MMVSSVESLRRALSRSLVPREKRIVRRERFGHVADKLFRPMGKHANLRATFGTIERVRDDKPRVFVEPHDHGLAVYLARAEEHHGTDGPTEKTKPRMLQCLESGL